MEEIYLLWSPQGWGVFNSCDCPDPYGLPSYWYKKYEVSSEDRYKLFNILINRQQKLVTQKVIPTIENYDHIFPDITKLL